MGRPSESHLSSPPSRTLTWSWPYTRLAHHSRNGPEPPRSAYATTHTSSPTPTPSIAAANRAGGASMNAVGWSASTMSDDQSRNRAPGTCPASNAARAEPSSRHRMSRTTSPGSARCSTNHSVDTSMAFSPGVG